ncbi:MAG TPA: glutathione S-transferase family protein [Thermoleophilaceae bacterium]|nr:glutathione S-transferase family protein [Thermoleophilaceae bacterium]
MILYDHPASANCMKPRILLRHLDLPYERVLVDLFKGETRTPDHFARNPDGRVPVLELDSGETIAESGAILLHLAEGTPYLPAGQLERTRVHQWLFFEQSRIEAELAYARFLRLSGRHEQIPEAYENRLKRGRDALKALDRRLSDGRDFVAGGDYSVADIALYAYVHCADDAGADLSQYEHIGGWVERVETQPGFVNDLEPLPPHAMSRPV